MTVTFTLTTTSTDAGPFNISGTTSGGALNGVSIATGISKATLVTGHSISNISETITGGTIASTGTCTTTDTWFVISATPTPTPTGIPAECWQFGLSPTIYGSQIDCQNATGGPCNQVICPEEPQ
jgi:hypothetical protein